MLRQSNIPSFDDLPNELKEIIFEQIKNYDDYCALKLTGNAWRDAASYSSHFGENSFFRKSYERSTVHYWLRKPETLSFMSINRGNFLSYFAIMAMLSEELIYAEPVLRVAAFCYGNPYAMQVINSLNKLPGRTALYVFPQELINAYKEKTYAILTNMYQTHFPEADWYECRLSLDITLDSINCRLTIFLDSLLHFYRKNGGLSLENYQDFSALYNKNLSGAALLTEFPNPIFFNNFMADLFVGFTGDTSKSEENKSYWFRSEKFSRDPEESGFLSLAQKQTGMLSYFAVKK